MQQVTRVRLRDSVEREHDDTLLPPSKQLLVCGLSPCSPCLNGSGRISESIDHHTSHELFEDSEAPQHVSTQSAPKLGKGRSAHVALVRSRCCSDGHWIRISKSFIAEAEHSGHPKHGLCQTSSACEKSERHSVFAEDLQCGRSVATVCDLVCQPCKVSRF